MSTLPVRLPKRLPFSGMAAPIRPLVQQLQEEAERAGFPKPGEPIRMLEAGSSGGLLSSLIFETPCGPHVKVADFADVSPETLEGAVERSSGWACRCHFINNTLEHLALRADYDLILTWGCFSGNGDQERMAQSLTARQKAGGLLLQFHDQAEPNLLGFALHRYSLLATRWYAASGGREPKYASAWGWRGRP